MTKNNVVTIVLLILGVVIIAFFGIRAFHDFRNFHGHHPHPPGKVETDVELIRDWMTVPFISHMYHIPDDMIFQALNIPPQENKEKSLKVLNDEYYPDKDGFVMDLVKTTILAHQPPPTPVSPPTTVSSPTKPVTP